LASRHLSAGSSFSNGSNSRADFDRPSETLSNYFKMSGADGGIEPRPAIEKMEGADSNNWNVSGTHL